MCGRYAFFNLDNFANRYLVDENSLDFAANYNISPGSMAPVITRNSPNSVKLMKWGLIPKWSKEFKMTFKTFNARLEGLTSSRLFSPLLKTNRCLIPANGFYEWTENDGKVPHYIHTQDQTTFSFAGLYDIWQDAEEKKFYSYTIITTTANSFMKSIHHRMPVILQKEAEEVWLDQLNNSPSTAIKSLQQYDASQMNEYVVSTKVNSSRHNSPELINSDSEPKLSH
jgi:putative SOS response-associated peptidase YedK